MYSTSSWIYTLHFADDLDIFVQTPGGDNIYYDEEFKFDPTTGGSLDVDVRPGEEGEAEFGTWTENINIPPSGPDGEYIVWVNQYKQKGSPDAFKLGIFDDENNPSTALYTYPFPAGLATGENTPCYTYNKPAGTISVSPGACDAFTPPAPLSNICDEGGYGYCPEVDECCASPPACAIYASCPSTSLPADYTSLPDNFSGSVTYNGGKVTVKLENAVPGGRYAAYASDETSQTLIYADYSSGTKEFYADVTGSVEWTFDDPGISDFSPYKFVTIDLTTKVGGFVVWQIAQIASPFEIDLFP